MCIPNAIHPRNPARVAASNTANCEACCNCSLIDTFAKNLFRLFFIVLIQSIRPSLNVFCKWLCPWILQYLTNLHVPFTNYSGWKQHTHDQASPENFRLLYDRNLPADERDGERLLWIDYLLLVFELTYDSDSLLSFKHKLAQAKSILLSFFWSALRFNSLSKRRLVATRDAMSRTLFACYGRVRSISDQANCRDLILPLLTVNWNAIL